MTIQIVMTMPRVIHDILKFQDADVVRTKESFQTKKEGERTARFRFWRQRYESVDFFIPASKSLPAYWKDVFFLEDTS